MSSIEVTTQAFDGIDMVEETKIFHNALLVIEYLDTLHSEEPAVVDTFNDTDTCLVWNPDVCGQTLSAYIKGATPERLLAAYERGWCTRCDGDGIIDCFMHVRHGICFRCKGEGLNPKEAAHA